MKVWKYGLLPPTIGAERVEAQMSLAHRYQNRLVEIERARRDEMSRLLADLGIASIDGEIAAIQGRVADARLAVMDERAATRKLDVGPKAVLKALRLELREACARRRDAVTALRGQATAQARIDALNDRYREMNRAARAECGLYWGTYLIVEQAMDAARKAPEPPRFRRWTGDGSVAVEIIHGADMANIIDGDDRRLKISTMPEPVPGRGGRPLPRLWLRVGSDGKDPVWASWPMIMHRPIPSSRVKWARVVRRRYATDYKWSVHFTLETMAGREEPCGRGDVTLAVGWRRVDGADGTTTRAGTWEGDDGRRGEVRIPQKALILMARAQSLRSIRDRNMTEAMAKLKGWLSAAALSDEWRARTLHLVSWKSQARLAALCLWWFDHRLATDGEALKALEAWRKQDKHLWCWEANARRKAIEIRRHAYRNVAAMLARTYGRLITPKLDLARLARTPEPDEERKKSHGSTQSQRFATAPGELRSACIQAILARGGVVVERERSGDTQMTVTARPSRFSVIAQKRAAKEARKAARGELLESRARKPVPCAV